MSGLELFPTFSGLLCLSLPLESAGKYWHTFPSGVLDFLWKDWGNFILLVNCSLSMEFPTGLQVQAGSRGKAQGWVWCEFPHWWWPPGEAETEQQNFYPSEEKGWAYLLTLPMFNLPISWGIKTFLSYLGHSQQLKTLSWATAPKSLRATNSEFAFPSA